MHRPSRGCSCPHWRDVSSNEIRLHQNKTVRCPISNTSTCENTKHTNAQAKVWATKRWRNVTNVFLWGKSNGQKFMNNKLHVLNVSQVLSVSEQWDSHPTDHATVETKISNQGFPDHLAESQVDSHSESVFSPWQGVVPMLVGRIIHHQKTAVLQLNDHWLYILFGSCFASCLKKKSHCTNAWITLGLRFKKAHDRLLQRVWGRTLVSVQVRGMQWDFSPPSLFRRLDVLQCNHCHLCTCPKTRTMLKIEGEGTDSNLSLETKLVIKRANNRCFWSISSSGFAVDRCETHSFFQNGDNTLMSCQGMFLLVMMSPIAQLWELVPANLHFLQYRSTKQ